MKLLGMILAVLMGSTASYAQSSTSNGLDVCFTGTGAMGAYHSDEQAPELMNAHLMYDHGRFVRAGLRCETLNELEFGLQTTVLAMSIGAAMATPTGLGIPVSVTLGIGAAGFGYLSFLVSKIDCEDDKKDFQKKVRDAVCEVLDKEANVHCGALHIEDIRPSAPMCTAEGVSI